MIVMMLMLLRKIMLNQSDYKL